MEDYREIYESNRVELVRNLRVHRTFLFDYLRSKQVLDKGDCELIQAESTSERKAGKLLDLLAHKGKNGFVCFTEALQLQSPELYEMLTGKDPESTPNPILTRYQNSRLGREGGMEVIEMELLTEHLSRSYAELQRISSQYNSIVKEKRKLEGKLLMNEVDLERQKYQVTAWEERFYQEKTCSLKKQTRAQKWLHTLAFEIDQGQETIKTLQANVIELRMKLLQANQEVEELRTKLNNANTKKDQAIRHRQEMGESYEKERKQAARLSLILQCQEGELQVLDEYKHRCGDLELSNAQMKDENERLQKELDELSKWTKGLKDRFDLIENDNIRAHENKRNVTQNIKALQDEIEELKQKSSYLEVENDFLKFRVTFLEKDCDIYKQQRDNAMTSRNEAAEERDKAWRERELAWHQYIEIQKARDSEIEKRVECMKEFDAMEERFNETASELVKTKLKLNEAELMLQEMKLNMNDTRTTEGTNDNEKESEVKSKPNVTSSNSNPETRVNSRRTLIESIRRRVVKSTADNGNDMTSLLHMSASSRTSHADFLVSLLSDFTEDIDDADDPLSNRAVSRWTSCPQLDEITNNEENASDFAINIAHHSLIARSVPDLCSFSGNPEVATEDIREPIDSHAADDCTSSSSSDSDNQTDPISESVWERMPDEQSFRRHTNDVSTQQYLSGEKPSQRRSNLLSPRLSLLRERLLKRRTNVLSGRQSMSGIEPVRRHTNVMSTQQNPSGEPLTRRRTNAMSTSRSSSEEKPSRQRMKLCQPKPKSNTLKI